jgi:hypothetical protein
MEGETSVQKLKFLEVFAKDKGNLDCVEIAGT